MKSRYWFLITTLALLLISLGILWPKSKTRADATIDNVNGVWQGTLGPAPGGNDILTNAGAVVVSANPANDGTYIAQLDTTQTSGNIISVTIGPDSSKFKSWNKIIVSVGYPQSGTSSLTFDVLCGDTTQTQCPTLNAVLGSYSNIDPSTTNGVIDISGLSSSIQRIRIRANWSRADVNTASVQLFSWSAAWNTNGPVNLFISHSPNPANPTAYPVGSGTLPPGVSNNSTVVYKLNYPVSQNSSNLVLTLPYPTGSYQGRPYTVTYVSSTPIGVNNTTAKTVTWNLGSISAGTIGAVSVTFTVNTGPPDGTILSTTANLTGTDSSNNPISINSVKDQLNISSKAYLSFYTIGPPTVAKSTTVVYLIPIGSTGSGWQSDIFNAKFQFTYSACTTYSSSTVPNGFSPPTVNTTNRTVTFSTGNYYFFPARQFFTVTVTAAASCGGTVDTSLQLISMDKLYSFGYPTTVNFSSTFDGTATPKFSITKTSAVSSTGSGELISYLIRFRQDSTVPVNSFYAIDQVPANTLFLSASISPGYLTTSGVNPNAANPWTIYSDSVDVSQPASNSPNWKPLNADGTSVDGTATKWIMYKVNTIYWDTQTNGEYPNGSFSVVTANPLSAGSIVNTITGYATNVCSSGCSSSLTIPAVNAPYYQLGYGANPASASSGGQATITGSVTNQYDYSGISSSDGKNNVVTMKLPDAQYLATTNPVVSAKATCPNVPITTTCPDINGNPVTNAPWLDATSSYNAAQGTVTWTIPLIYSFQDYPQKMPFSYQFQVVLNTRNGLPDQTTAVCSNLSDGNSTKCLLSVSGQNSSQNLPSPVTKSVEITPYLTITSAPILNLTKTSGSSQISYGGAVTYNLQYTNTGNGSATNFYLMDNIPQNSNYNPVAKMTYVGATNPHGEVLYYLAGQSRDIRPTVNDPRWTAFPVPAGSEPTVDWIKWQVPSLAINTSFSVSLTTKDSGSSNGVIYSNKAYIGYINSSNSEVVANSASIGVTVSNPGFIQANKGNVGSISGIGFGTSGGSSVYYDSSTQFAGGGSTSYSWGHLVGNQQNRLLLVGVSIRSNAPPSAASVISIKDNTNGQFLTLYPSVGQSGGLRTEFWYLIGPPSGNNNLTITLTTGATAPWGSVVGSSSWFNVNQSTPIDQFATAPGPCCSPNPTVTINTSSTHTVVDAMSMPNGSSDIVYPGAGQQQLWNLYSPGDEKGAGSSKQGSSNTKMTWVTKSEAWDISAVAIQPAGNTITSVDYLGVSNTINTCCFKSLKSWLVYGNNYHIDSKQISYSQYWSDYSRQATPCSSVADCFSSGGVKIYDETGPPTLPPFVIDTSTPNTYNGLPLILFINGTSANNWGAMNISTNFTVGANTGVIFVVNGHVKVDPAVSTVNGGFLVDGQFTTGTLGTSSGNANTGRYAAIAIGSDGNPRIVYTADNSVRFINCQDKDCNQRAYNFITTISSISSIYFQLDSGTNSPRIVIGQSASSGGKVTYISCTDQYCNGSNSKQIDPNGLDPDLVLNSGIPNIAEGTGASAPRAAATVLCSDTNCSSAPITTVDNGGSPAKDRGNDNQISLDGTTQVITYVDRSSTPSNLYMARKNSTNTGTGCSIGSSWDCRKISSSTQGDIGKQPSLVLNSGLIRVAYNNRTKSTLDYIECSAKVCDSTTQQTLSVDCGASCTALDNASMVTNSSGQVRVVYNIQEPASILYNIRFNYCNSSCTSLANWKASGQNIEPSDVSGSPITPGVQAFGQALALGPEQSDPTIDYPRIVYYNSVTRNLVYVRCSAKDCSSIPTRKVLDDGSPMKLADQQLTINGFVIAYGNNTSDGHAFKLQRDLFSAASSTSGTPGEVFTFEPKYYYLFKSLLKFTETTKELPP